MFGLRGELKCDPSGAGRDLFVPGAALRCVRDGTESEATIAGVRPHKGRLLIRIEGVDDADAAQHYVGATFYVAREAIELAPGEYLFADLAGCSVVGLDGTEYGTVERVENYPASDMLIVGGKMVPMVAAIVRDIDVRNRRITIDPPADLL